jgi:hypothetical protein
MFFTPLIKGFLSPSSHLFLTNSVLLTKLSKLLIVFNTEKMKMIWKKHGNVPEGGGLRREGSELLGLSTD